MGALDHWLDVYWLWCVENGARIHRSWDTVNRLKRCGGLQILGFIYKWKGNGIL